MESYAGLENEAAEKVNSFCPLTEKQSTLHMVLMMNARFLSVLEHWSISFVSLTVREFRWKHSKLYKINDLVCI